MCKVLRKHLTLTVKNVFKYSEFLFLVHIFLAIRRQPSRLKSADFNRLAALIFLAILIRLKHCFSLDYLTVSSLLFPKSYPGNHIRSGWFPNTRFTKQEGRGQRSKETGTATSTATSLRQSRQKSRWPRMLV